MTLRCTMKCTSLTPGAGVSTTAAFSAIPLDKNKPEDQNFSLASNPTGSLSLVIDNPEMLSSVKVGDYYYVEVVKTKAVVAG